MFVYFGLFLKVRTKTFNVCAHCTLRKLNHAHESNMLTLNSEIDYLVEQDVVVWFMNQYHTVTGG